MKTFRGFTLIELMIVVAILAIIAAVAMPAYNNQVDKTRRADAKTALLSAAQQIERCFTRNNSYAGCTVDAASPDGFYNVAFSEGPAATSFTLRAVPTGKQQRDASKCTNFTVNHLGERDASGSESDKCWN